MFIVYLDYVEIFDRKQPICNGAEELITCVTDPSNQNSKPSFQRS